MGTARSLAAIVLSLFCGPSGVRSLLLLHSFRLLPLDSVLFVCKIAAQAGVHIMIVTDRKSDEIAGVRKGSAHAADKAFS